MDDIKFKGMVLGSAFGFMAGMYACCGHQQPYPSIDAFQSYKAAVNECVGKTNPQSPPLDDLQACTWTEGSKFLASRAGKDYWISFNEASHKNQEALASSAIGGLFGGMKFGGIVASIICRRRRNAAPPGPAAPSLSAANGIVKSGL